MVDFSKVAGVVLYTTDMSQALAFYTKILGFKVVESDPSFATLQLQNMKRYLHLADNPPDPDLSERRKLPQLSFKVKNIDEALQHLHKAGVRITREIVEYNPTTFVFNFLDPDGNPLACESKTRIQQ
jgi:catechol 2,3-dioxygenase-like lactoylglutathione lyase family enzyme